MSEPHDDYKRLEVPAGGPSLYACPVCGSPAELWQYSESETSLTTKAVCCSRADPFGPQDAIVNEGCLLYMPPGVFYKATMRDAIKYWNDYAVALMKLQRANRWKDHQILRDKDKTRIRSATPPEFRDMPIGIARRAAKPLSQAAAAHIEGTTS